MTMTLHQCQALSLMQMFSSSLAAWHPMTLKASIQCGTGAWFHKVQIWEQADQSQTLGLGSQEGMQVAKV